MKKTRNIYKRIIGTFLSLALIVSMFPAIEGKASEPAVMEESVENTVQGGFQSTPVKVKVEFADKEVFEMMECSVTMTPGSVLNEYFRVVEEPVHPDGTHSFKGWQLCFVDMSGEAVPVEEAEVISTEQVLEYIIPEYDFVFQSVWEEIVVEEEAEEEVTVPETDLEADKSQMEEAEVEEAVPEEEPVVEQIEERTESEVLLAEEEKHFIEIDYSYFGGNYKYVSSPVTVEIDGVSTYRELLKIAEKNILHETDLGFSGWEYSIDEELLDQVAEEVSISAKAEYKKICVTGKVFYFNTKGEQVSITQFVVVDKDATYQDVFDMLKLPKRSTHYAKGYFDGWQCTEGLKNKILQTGADETKLTCTVTPKYEKYPMVYSYTYLTEDGVAKTVTEKVSLKSGASTMSYFDNLVLPMDAADRTYQTWVFSPESRYTSKANAAVASLHGAMQYDGITPVFTTRTYVDQNLNTPIVEEVCYVKANPDDKNNFEKELLETVKNLDTQSYSHFELQGYEVKGEPNYSREVLTGKYYKGIEYKLSALYDKALLITEMPDAPAAKTTHVSGEKYTLPKSEKCQVLYWDIEKSFQKTKTLAGGKTVTLDTPYTKITGSYHEEGATHKYGEWILVKESTYTVKGSQERICSACGKKETEKLPLVKADSIELNVDEVNLIDGQTEELFVSCTPLEPGQDEVKWTTSNKAVATVSKSGKITAEGKGTATIKVSVGGKTASCTVTVEKQVYAPKTLTLKLTGHDDVSVSWGKSSNASGYFVYYMAEDDEDFEELVRTTKRSCSAANLSDGKEYTFRIVPYKIMNGERVESSKYVEKKITTLQKLEDVTVKKYSSKQIRVSWDKIDGTTGYQVYKSTKSSSGFTKAASVGSSYKSKKLTVTKGKTYYYKVRAYKKEGTKYIYGPWSEVVKFKL